jgi:uroporphyrinogen-III synthase
MTALKALVTRPREDAEDTAALLQARGIEPVIEPMMTIAQVAGARPQLAGVQALLFTSANGARAFAAACQAGRDLPVFAVGEATAAKARDLGFAHVTSAGGDVEDLARVAAERLDPKAGALLHAAGSAVARDLGEILGREDFTVRREILYEAQPVENLSPRTAAQFRDNGIAIVLFFSPRTAAVFVTLARKAAIEAAIRRCTAFCLSPAVVSAANQLSWGKTISAARPALPALIDEIDAWLDRTPNAAKR